MRNIRRIIGSPEYIPRIKDMKIGEVGYIVPWSINEKNWNVDLETPYNYEPGGTVTVKITRVGQFFFDIEYLEK